MPDTFFLDESSCECDVTLDTWLKDALSYLPGIDRDVARRELVLAAREFFERTLAWKAVIENVHAKAGQKQYWTSPYDQYANVIAIDAVTYNGRQLSPLTHRPMVLGAEGFTTTSAPTSFYSLNPPDSFYLHPPMGADSENALDIYVCLTPKQSVEHLPRIAAIKFYDAILESFLSRTLRHPNKPYSDQATASYYRRSFIARCGNYIGEAKQGFLGAPGRTFPGGWGKKPSGVR